MTQLIDIRDLSVKFPTRFGEFLALDRVSLDVNPGEIHGLVGESGAGKSTVGAAVMGLLQTPGYVSGGEVLFGGYSIELARYSYCIVDRWRCPGFAAS